MEITEVVTPSVAIPVLGVLVCAFLVFAFGFKSPGQPPSFEAFDEDSKRKRNKRSKVSSSVLINNFHFALVFKHQVFCAVLTLYK